MSQLSHRALPTVNVAKSLASMKITASLLAVTGGEKVVVATMLLRHTLYRDRHSARLSVCQLTFFFFSPPRFVI